MRQLLKQRLLRGLPLIVPRMMKTRILGAEVQEGAVPLGGVVPLEGGRADLRVGVDPQAEADLRVGADLLEERGLKISVGLEEAGVVRVSHPQEVGLLEEVGRQGVVQQGLEQTGPDPIPQVGVALLGEAEPLALETLEEVEQQRVKQTGLDLIPQAGVKLLEEAEHPVLKTLEQGAIL